MVGLNANSRGEGEEGAGLHRLALDLTVLLPPSFPLEPSPFPCHSQGGNLQSEHQMAHSSAIFRQCFCGDADSRGRGTLSSGLPNQIKCKGYCICAGANGGI